MDKIKIGSLVNRENSLFAIYSVTSLLLFLIFLLGNAMMYVNAYQFAKEYGADEIVIDYDEVPDYQSAFFTDQFSAPVIIDYKPSHFKFYADGEDIIVEQNLYIQYQDLNIINNSYIAAFDLFIVLNFITVAIGFISAGFARYFPHPYVAGTLLFILVVFINIDLYLNVGGILFTLALLIINTYFAKKNRFCDYNENRWTAIFK